MVSDQSANEDRHHIHPGQLRARIEPATIGTESLLVQDITGIPCSIHYGRRIDLDRSRNFLRGVQRSKSQKTDFWPKNGLFLVVFQSPRLTSGKLTQTLNKPGFYIISTCRTRWCQRLVLKHRGVSRNVLGQNWIDTDKIGLIRTTFD